MTRIAVISACVGIVALLCWLTFRAATASLFSRNPMYEITHLEIDSTSRVVNEYIRGELKIRQGGNLFGFNIQNARRTFLRFAPHYRSMEITRILPNKLEISLVERQPVAQIGHGGGYAVDIEKRVFNRRDRKQLLPVVSGYKGPILKPGDRLTGLAADAITVVEALDDVDPEDDVVLRGIDVSGPNTARPEALRLHLEGEAIVDLWWKRSKEGAGNSDLRTRLADVAQIVADSAASGRKLKVVTLITDDPTKNAVEYWN